MYFCGVSRNFSFFFSDIIDLGPPFFLMSLAAAKSLQSCPTLCNPTDGSRFINFVYLFKERGVSFIDLLYCFSISIPFISSLIFYDLFPSTNMDFISSSFSSSFRYNVTLFVEDFFVS